MAEVDSARKQRLSEARRKLLEKRLKGAAWSEEGEQQIPRRERSDPAPLSLAQERFWFLNQLNPKDPTYNMHEAWQVEGDLDIDALASAVNQVVARQATLRMTIGKHKGQLVQIIHEEMPIELSVHDLSHLAGEAQQEQVQQMAIAEARALFDLYKGPLLRFTVLRQSATRHTLMYTIHHIVSDENSNDIFWRELTHFYLSEVGNQTKESSIPKLPIQYDDFSEWQREWLSQEEHDRQMSYWEKRLAGEAKLLELPLDKVRPTLQTARGGMIQRRFADDLTGQVQSLAQRSGVTPFMIFMALFQLLLNRYSQQDDIWVGTPIANRQRSEVKDLIGLFLNTIVIRTQFQPELSFNNLLELVKHSSFDAFSHQDLPFEQLVDHLQPPRDPAYHPLFQVMFVYSPTEALSRSIPGLEMSKLRVDGGVAKFDLTLFVASGTDGIEVGLEYNTDLFKVETIERMLVHLEVLLRNVLSQPNLALNKVNFISEIELEQLAAWNPQPLLNAQSAYLLHQLIEANALQNPGKTAVQFADESLSYGDLIARATQLSAVLIRHGVNRGDFVGLYAERRPEMLVGILAILKAGGAYVPIDPEYPTERIQHIMEDAALKVVLSCSASELPENSQATTLLQINEVLQANSEQDYPVTHPDISPDDLAYLIYTSGSTGKPKGVMVSHANIVHSTTARYSFYERPIERFLLLSSFAFDSSMVGIFWTLCGGGTLVLLPAGMHQNVRYICDTVSRQKVTHLLALPSLYQVVLEESIPGQLASLNTVIVAGEACHLSLVALHYEQQPQTDLYNEYGPTEGTVWSHAYRFPTDFVGPTVPIGTAIPNVQGFVLDRNQQLLPVGVPGELVLAGAGISAGYLNQPELTAEKFISIPGLGFTESAKLYRTGDLVRWRPDGNLDFLGRVDHQVKIRGFRIELGEIEALLLDHPEVSNAAVVVHNNGTIIQPDNQLIAYYVTKDRTDDATLISYLSELLPSYMIPTLFVSLPSFPISANGKVNRQALPALEKTVTTGNIEYAGPRDELEQMLVEHWQRLLNAKQIGVHDNFFALGGHSLLALRLFARIEEITGRKMLLSTLFEAPTVAELAERIRDRDYRPEWTSLVPIKPEGFKRPYFYVSPYQISVLELRMISNYFDQERPFYGLQPQGLHEAEETHDSIQAMAAHYIEAIQSIQAEGPYLIGGHCAGGWVAYEMALQLEALGETVQYLGIVDMPAPDFRLPDESRWKRISKRLAYYAKDNRLIYAVAWQLKLQVESKLLFRYGSPQSRRIQAVRDVHDKAYANYDFERGYQGPLHLVRSSDNMSILSDPTWYKNWEKMTPQPVVYSDIHSTHARLLFDPEAKDLAESFVEEINKAEGRSA